MDWLACRAARGTDGLHPGVWSRSRICSGFSRSDGQAATHGHTNCWLLCFRHRVFDSQDQLQLANYLRADCCRFFAHLFDSHWSDSKQLGKARLKLSDRSLPDLSGFSFRPMVLISILPFLFRPEPSLRSEFVALATESSLSHFCEDTLPTVQARDRLVAKKRSNRIKIPEARHSYAPGLTHVTCQPNVGVIKSAT